MSLNRSIDRGLVKKLDAMKPYIESTPQYDIIKQGQGLATRLLGLKRSSLVALEEMISDVKKAISSKLIPM